MKTVEKIYCTAIDKTDDFKEYLRNYIDEGTPSTQYEDGEIQCVSGKTRSLDMLYSLTIGLYPDVTFEEFLKAIAELAKEMNAAIIECGDTKKITFYTESSASYFNAFKHNGLEWSNFGIVKPLDNNDLYTVLDEYTMYDLYNILNEEHD